MVGRHGEIARQERIRVEIERGEGESVCVVCVGGSERDRKLEMCVWCVCVCGGGSERDRKLEMCVWVCVCGGGGVSGERV